MREAVRGLLASEEETGLTDPATYAAFRGRVHDSRDRLVHLLTGLRGDIQEHDCHKFLRDHPRSGRIH